MTDASHSDEETGYLIRLTGRVREEAERYVQRARAQVSTPYRRRIQAAFNWTPRPAS